MEYFSEIYGNYYRAVLAVLARACVSPLTESEISEIITREVSAESAFYITPNLTSGKWALLTRKDGLFYPVTKHNIIQPMSALQRKWLCAMLDDVRCSAFFDEDEINGIKTALGTSALYDQRRLLSIDVCSDGDPFANPDYRLRLRTIIDAIRSEELIRVSYDGAKGSRITADILPCRLEYSPKDNKMRLLAIKVRYGKPILTMTVNLSRITDIEPSSEKMPEKMVDFDELERFCRHRSHQNEPVVIELTGPAQRTGAFHGAVFQLRQAHKAHR